jgi:hypothetical protein
VCKGHAKISVPLTRSVSAKEYEMKIPLLIVTLLILFASSIHAEEASQNSKSRAETEEEAERYFDCRSIKASDLKDPNAPTFSSYPIALEDPIIHPKVDTKTTTIGRRYRTVLRNGIESGANFAGHYAVVVWGCGSSCSSFAIVNLKTGKVIVPNDISSVIGMYLDNSTEQFLPEGLHGYWGYRYILDSSLLVLVGMLNEKETHEGAYYFVIENDGLKQVYQTEVIKDCKR